MAIALAGLLGVSCVPPLPDPDVVQTLAPGSREILLARRALEPVVPEVLAGIRGLATGVDQVRHQVPRGQAMRNQITELAASADQLEVASRELGALADQMQSPETQDARTIVGRLSMAALTTVVATRADLAQLEPILAFDDELQATVDAWDQAGSRPQLAEAFAVLAGEAQVEVGSARRLSVGRCQAMRTNRIRWAGLVAARTAQLRDTALNGQGTAFDELRRRFSRAPYGEDRQVADSESTACWTRGSPLPGLADDADRLLPELQASLRG